MRRQGGEREGEGGGKEMCFLWNVSSDGTDYIARTVQLRFLFSERLVLAYGLIYHTGVLVTMEAVVHVTIHLYM